ncbi:hypothetical protein [Paraburkholderia graminis]|uniref:hypothetical protein n=1 Tax=Paraburkholderia graminis TaxID=60548 RepID=UPI0038B970D2
MKPKFLRLITLRLPHRARVAPCALGMTWRPLSLCWKRALPRAGGTVAGTVSRPLHQFFHTQSHLHVAVLASAPSRQARPSAPAHAMFSRVAVAHWARIHHEHPQVHRHTLRYALERVRHEQVRSFERFPPRLIDAAATLRAPRAALSITTSEAAAWPHRPPASCTQIASTRLPRARLVPVTQYPRAAASHARRETPAEMQRAASASPGFVWLKPAAPGLTTEAVPTPAGADTASGIEGVARVARIADATPIVAAAVQALDIAGEARRALLLDSAFTNRLADDVLRKVDKRERIERERRGL